jgi:hypothetical protein
LLKIDGAAILCGAENAFSSWCGLTATRPSDDHKC